MFYVEILGLLPEMAEAEVKALAELRNGTIKERDYLLVVGNVENVEIFERLGLAHEYGILLGSGDDVRDILDLVRGLEWKEIIKGTFAVRKEVMVNCAHEVKNLEKIIGGIIHSQGLRVNLSKPDTIIKVYCGRKLWIGIRIREFRGKEFDERKADRRPFSRPIALPPRIARAMVNLTRATREILDPFMGTGGMLIEAGLMGLKVYGIDIREDMVEGAKINLEYYGVKDYVVKVGDATKIKEAFPGKTFEAIATDPPYGTSTTLPMDRDELYKRALESMYSVLEGRLAIAFPSDFDALDVAETIGFKVIGRFYQRVHSSLSRYFYIMEAR
ncbi:TIGR01177 family methyltransferase [Pyrococcus abyssi]|uniref:tRNA (guanine(10)-N2)-dimethyltransferase n=1 Tax=Pyrococcus abyssi (strain GE5 / Orsay) TaxID=272844 RepID=TMG10_PYRAB|nr:TIGR01177 family methyltransferase [Pyrococcus abyssi]Q9UY84.2 RecName: Full=tRNA (guanine(10)-N2)-dimethyltransferase; AltName: Full=(Pab)Trm-G10; AltName: Full=tRNA:G10 dimethyltransferase [Pyrococcus abyssi GE5]CCE71085.1 TPA: N2, N2-dimethylguanosine tRNA methyltransferase [Pyrococcus abyssi GE5]